MEKANIFQKMNSVMKMVSYIQKEKKTVNGQYRFASHDAVVSALQGPFVEVGIVMLPSIKELTQDGNRTTVCMDITFVNIDTPEDRFTVCSYGFGIDTQDKGVGKAVSYAVKYALLKNFMLETGDDPEKDQIEYSPAVMDDKKVTELKNRCFAKFDTAEHPLLERFFDTLMGHYKIPMGEILQKYAFAENELIEHFEKYKKKNGEQR